MLRDYRCARYAVRLKELAHFVRLPRCLDDRVVSSLASDYADRTMPTLGERFAKSESGELTAASGDPAPTSVWEEDAALLKGLLDHYNVRPTMDMAMTLYTATLCRHAGMSACEESNVAQRMALPEGKSLGDLLVAFVYGDIPEAEA